MFGSWCVPLCKQTFFPLFLTPISQGADGKRFVRVKKVKAQCVGLWVGFLGLFVRVMFKTVLEMQVLPWK